MWGREVAGRLAARLGAGLTGDATGLELADGRLVAWKPAFGGQLEAAITSRSRLQMVTVRPGVLPVSVPRAHERLVAEMLAAEPRSRVRVLDTGRDDDVEILATAPVVIGLGAGVDPARYGELDDLLAVLGATLGASRKVTDKAWMPRARQIGITGRSIQPRLYVAVGVSGKFNHVIGVRAAHTVLAINADARAPIFAAADIGIVGDWAEVVALLAERVGGRRASVA
jgi:electron transfer flavoprotein alpha subunit